MNQVYAFHRSTMDHKRLFHSTRLRLASWYVTVMGSILTLCGIGVYQVVAHAYQETIREGLESVSSALQSSIEPVLQQPDQLQPLAQKLSVAFCRTQADCSTHSFSSTPAPIADPVTAVTYYLRLSDPNNQPIALAGLPLTQLPLTANHAHWQTIRDQSGINYQQVTLPLNTHGQPWGYLQIGRSLTDMEQHLRTLRWTLLLGFPVAMLLIGWSSWWLAGLAMQPIYRSYQQMHQFTSDAAHELRTPLTAMQTTIELALTQADRLTFNQSEATSSTPLMILKRQNTRLIQLVRDLLLLTRLDQQGKTGNCSRCCLNDLIEDLIEELASLAIAAQVKLTAQMPPAERIYIYGNQEQLYRLVCNLIDNAIQATPAGGRVTVLLDRRDHQAILTVEDTGVGIAPENQPHIFDRFYRIQTDRSRHTGGSGLGLAIAWAIAQAHQGSIHVESQLGQGSVFTVRLPLD